MGILKIIVYIIIIFFSYFFIKKDQKLYVTNKIKFRLRIRTIILISIIIGFFSLSYDRTFWWQDVDYYSRLFSNGNSIPESTGLNVIYSILHLFTNNIDVLLFVIATISTFVMLLSYRMYEQAYPISVLFLFLSDFFFETCQVNLKQAIACGLSSFFILFAIKKRYFFSVICIVTATMFHITACPILIITFIALKLISIKNRRLKLLVFVITISSIFIIQPIINIMITYGSFIPGLVEKLTEYTNDSNQLIFSSTIIVALKGLPYYLITIVGIYYRKFLQSTIKYYDELLIISIVASISYILSGYSYWMSRIIGYYLMTDFIFLGLILSNIKNKNNYVIIKYNISLLLLIFTFRELIQIYILL